MTEKEIMIAVDKRAIEYMRATNLFPTVADLSEWAKEIRKNGVDK